MRERLSASRVPAVSPGDAPGRQDTDLNNWIRTTKIFDGVIDFDRVMRDPQYPIQMRQEYNSGDFVHPNDAGYKAMADAIDLSLFT